MITYKDRTFCTFSECINFYPSRCGRVLTDYDLRNLRDGDYLLSTFAEHPECFTERSSSSCNSNVKHRDKDTKGGM